MRIWNTIRRFALKPSKWNDVKWVPDKRRRFVGIGLLCLLQAVMYTCAVLFAAMTIGYEVLTIVLGVAFYLGSFRLLIGKRHTE